MRKPVGMAEEAMSKRHGTKDFWLSALRADGASFRLAVGSTALDAPVPTCPEWTVGELVRHLGTEFAQVTNYVAHQGVSRPDRVPVETPPDPELLTWWDDRYATLLRQLELVDPEQPAWNWAPQAKKAVFWHRRAAHETAIHRWDAQVAGGPAEPVEAKLAVDGIGEVLDSWLPAGRRLVRSGDVRGIVALHATDVDQLWYARFRGAGIALLDTDTLLDDDQPHERAQASGTASDLMLALWGRVPFDVLEIAGDPRLLHALRAA